MKPGWKTTEFWLTVLGSVWSIFGSSAPPAVQVAVPAVLGAAYTISRGIAKKTPPAPAAASSNTTNVIGPGDP